MIYIILRAARLYFPGACLLGYISTAISFTYIVKSTWKLDFVSSFDCVIFFLHPFGLPFCFAICLKITCVREQGECQNMLTEAP